MSKSEDKFLLSPLMFPRVFGDYSIREGQHRRAISLAVSRRRALELCLFNIVGRLGDLHFILHGLLKSITSH